MTERKDLISICRNLNIINSDELANDKTDIELLRLILDNLNVSVGDTSNTSYLGHKLNTHDLPDSLAFPASTRKSTNLVEQTELWDKLAKFNDLLKLDYACRRQMLLNRLDCTVESFKWKNSSDQVASNRDNSRPQVSSNDQIHEKYDTIRRELKDEPQIGLDHLLALRENERDYLLNSVVSSKKIDCQVSYKTSNKLQQDRLNETLINLKQVIIPDVPDRGGRPGEIRPPQRETFSQQRRSRGRGGRR